MFPVGGDVEVQQPQAEAVVGKRSSGHNLASLEAPGLTASGVDLDGRRGRACAHSPKDRRPALVVPKMAPSSESSSLDNYRVTKGQALFFFVGLTGLNPRPFDPQ
jgi:hypothetical protein